MAWKMATTRRPVWRTMSQALSCHCHSNKGAAREPEVAIARRRQFRTGLEQAQEKYSAGYRRVCFHCPNKTISA
jgi:hypothetical protein